MITRMAHGQSAKSHAAVDRLVHFFLLPVFLINIGVAIFWALHRWHTMPLMSAWRVVVAIALFFAVARIRIYALANQDRIIRLEERLRLSTLAPGLELSRLTTRQLIALRFASDAELPALAHRAIKENLDPKAIKSGITDWRPDDERI